MDTAKILIFKFHYKPGLLYLSTLSFALTDITVDYTLATSKFPSVIDTKLFSGPYLPHLLVKLKNKNSNAEIPNAIFQK